MTKEKECFLKCIKIERVDSATVYSIAKSHLPHAQVSSIATVTKCIEKHFEGRKDAQKAKLASHLLFVRVVVSQQVDTLHITTLFFILFFSK